MLTFTNLLNLLVIFHVEVVNGAENVSFNLIPRRDYGLAVPKDYCQMKVSGASSMDCIPG